MPNTYLDMAIEAVPEFGNRISLFTKKLRLAQYADSTTYSYRLKITQAVLYLKKLPNNFTQADVDDYLTMLLDRSIITCKTNIFPPCYGSPTFCFISATQRRNLNRSYGGLLVIIPHRQFLNISIFLSLHSSDHNIILGKNLNESIGNILAWRIKLTHLCSTNYLYPTAHTQSDCS